MIRLKHQTRQDSLFEIGILEQRSYAAVDRLNLDLSIFIPGFWAA
jgi:hypothetical protein